MKGVFRLMEAFRRYLLGLQGEWVQLERGGPEACLGWLQSVQADYLTLRYEDGSELHLPLHHIRSVTRVPLQVPVLTPPDGPTPPPTFRELLAASRGRLVRLYHAGPEMSVGILRDCAEDHLLLEIAQDEVVCYSLFHIRSLYLFTLDAAAPATGAADPGQGG